MEQENLDVLKEIRTIIDWWYTHQREGSFKSLERYDYTNQKLSALIYYFSEQVGQNCTDYLLSYVHRKVGYSKRKKFHRDKNLTLGASENEAEIEMADKLEEEAVAEGIYETSKLLLNAAKGVSEAIRQRISIIKSEK